MNGIELMAGAMEAMRTRLDIAAGNLANASSDGFHRRLARVSLGARGFRTIAQPDASQGPLKATGRPFDIAVSGRGGFEVRDPDGRVRIAHAGSFERDGHGLLRDAGGRELLCERGPLRVGPEARIDARGIVRDGGRVIGRLRVHDGAEIHSGFLEGSNVDAIHEMVDILSAQRSFETAQKTLSAIDDVRSKAASDVARVKA